MAKASKPKREGKKGGMVDEPLRVTGPFMDTMEAADKNGEANAPAIKATLTRGGDSGGGRVGG